MIVKPFSVRECLDLTAEVTRFLTHLGKRMGHDIDSCHCHVCHSFKLIQKSFEPLRLATLEEEANETP